MAGTPPQGAGRQNGNSEDMSASHCIPAMLKTLPLEAASACLFRLLIAMPVK